MGSEMCIRDSLSFVKPRVELLADNDFEPAALPRVDGLNLVSAAARLKPMKGVAFRVEIFPKFVCPPPVRVAGENSQPLSLHISARSQRAPTERNRRPVHTELAVSPIIPLEIDIHVFIICRSFHRKTSHA